MNSHLQTQNRCCCSYGLGNCIRARVKEIGFLSHLDRPKRSEYYALGARAFLLDGKTRFLPANCDNPAQTAAKHCGLRNIGVNLAWR